MYRPAKGVWGVEPHQGFESLRFRQTPNIHAPYGRFFIFTIQFAYQSVLDCRRPMAC